MVNVKDMIVYGINVVGGVFFGKGGCIYLDLLVFNLVKEVSLNKVKV